jgi:hypothetical protein
VLQFTFTSVPAKYAKPRPGNDANVPASVESPTTTENDPGLATPDNRPPSTYTPSPWIGDERPSALGRDVNRNAVATPTAKAATRNADRTECLRAREMRINPLGWMSETPAADGRNERTTPGMRYTTMLRLSSDRPRSPGS